MPHKTIEQRCAYKRRWRARHPERDNQYRETHREAIQLKNKRWHEKNRAKERIRIRLQAARRRAKDPQKANALIKEWRAKNPERARALQRKNKQANRIRTARFRQNNPEKIKLYKQKYRASDPMVRILCNLRMRLHTLIRKPGIGRINTLVGCERDFLIGWLEAGFQPGMSWQNYGRRGWHVDHIKPCASFNLSDPVQLRQCFHFTNLQPLWASHNMSKGPRFRA